ncbi:hypothetical protein GCM10009550_44240 [Actinocorallia libanotica]|uniref:Uncharacterized protein n=1 Tax=Actinocorallia libanotica TaxID=46162 RepID=A0ABP4BYE7_9ACTN
MAATAAAAPAASRVLDRRERMKLGMGAPQGGGRPVKAGHVAFMTPPLVETYAAPFGAGRRRVEQEPVG